MGITFPVTVYLILLVPIDHLYLQLEPAGTINREKYKNTIGLQRLLTIVELLYGEKFP